MRLPNSQSQSFRSHGSVIIATRSPSYFYVEINQIVNKLITFLNNEFWGFCGRHSELWTLSGSFLSQRSGDLQVVPLTPSSCASGRTRIQVCDVIRDMMTSRSLSHLRLDVAASHLLLADSRCIPIGLGYDWLRPQWGWRGVMSLPSCWCNVIIKSNKWKLIEYIYFTRSILLFCGLTSDHLNINQSNNWWI